ncbi:hypothetical protein HFO39_22950 [Rhizobium leguminosarum]|nr:hypothetical protein [Rhizobium leguminosarum]
MAGVVLQTGPGVIRIKAGDRVMAALGGVGAYTDFLVIDVEKLVLTPEGLSDVEAAAIPVAAMTAWHVIQAADFDLSGRGLLIQGAAGGLGGSAVQFAKMATTNGWRFYQRPLGSMTDIASKPDENPYHSLHWRGTAVMSGQRPFPGHFVGAAWGSHLQWH